MQRNRVMTKSKCRPYHHQPSNASVEDIISCHNKNPMTDSWWCVEWSGSVVVVGNGKKSIGNNFVCVVSPWALTRFQVRTVMIVSFCASRLCSRCWLRIMLVSPPIIRVQISVNAFALAWQFHCDGNLTLGIGSRFSTDLSLVSTWIFGVLSFPEVTEDFISVI